MNPVCNVVSACLCNFSAKIVQKNDLVKRKKMKYSFLSVSFLFKLGKYQNIKSFLCFAFIFPTYVDDDRWF